MTITDKQLEELQLRIIETEIIDNTTEINGKYQIAEVSVLVKIRFLKKDFYLDFQTSNTSDYGAFSSDLAAYDGTDDYSNLQDFVEETDFLTDLFQEILDTVKEKADANKKWDEYVNENYKRNSDHFGGMDANSEINEAVKRD